METKTTVIAIHDLSPFGGQDRSTLEIARRLSHSRPLEIVAYTCFDPSGKPWGNWEFHQVRPRVRRPVMVKIILFWFATVIELGFRRWFRIGPPKLIHATGACSMVSDVVHVQFVHASWVAIRAREAAEDGLIEKGNEKPQQVGSLPRTLEDRAKHFARGGWRTWMDRIKGEYHHILERINLWSERRLFTKNKTYIAISHSVAADLKTYFGLTDQVHVIHHGVDTDWFKPLSESDRPFREHLRKQWGAKATDCVFLLVGAYERKGVGVCIEALAKLPATLRERALFVAYGNGPTADFMAKARALGVEGRVRLYPPSREIEKVFRCADVFVLPTRYETFGLVITEAMASGLPVLVSRCAGGAELVENGKSGYLIENPRDVGELVRLLEKVLSNDDARREMGSAARAQAENYTWDHVAEKYEQVLQKL